MKKVIASILAVAAVVLLNGCASTTPIKKLFLPPVKTIEGKVTHLDEGGFTLMDASGSIYVSAKLPDDRKLGLSIGEKVKVFGNLQGGVQEKIFDGYVIRRSTGQQIIVSDPVPQMGFYLQSHFEGSSPSGSTRSQ